MNTNILLFKGGREYTKKLEKHLDESLELSFYVTIFSQLKIIAVLSND